MVNNFNEDTILVKKHLKNDIKKTAGKCISILVVLSISTYIFADLIIIALKYRGQMLGVNLSGSNGQGLVLGISKDAYTFFLGYLPCVLGDILAILIGKSLLQINIKRDLFCKNQASLRFISLGSVSCIAVGMISSTIYLIYSSVIESRGLVIPAPDFSLPSGRLYIFLFFSYTCILAPVFEEIIFRGIILKSLMKFGNLSAIIVSSILFSLFHFNLVQFVNPVLMGIIFSFIAIKSNSIKSTIIAHMFNNSLIMAMTLIAGFNNPIVNYIVSIGYLIVGIISFIKFISSYKDDFFKIVTEKNSLLKTYKKIWYSFSNLWGVIYVALYIAIIYFGFVSKNIIK